MTVIRPQLKEKVLEEVARFPEEKLRELYDVIHHLRLGIEADSSPEKHHDASNQECPTLSKASSSAFLLSIAGIGTAEEDLSERDEEILSQEIDPIRGWGLKRDTPS
jgi:hypothetical protein